MYHDHAWDFPRASAISHCFFICQTKAQTAVTANTARITLRNAQSWWVGTSRPPVNQPNMLNTLHSVVYRIQLVPACHTSSLTNITLALYDSAWVSSGRLYLWETTKTIWGHESSSLFSPDWDASPSNKYFFVLRGRGSMTQCQTTQRLRMAACQTGAIELESWGNYFEDWLCMKYRRVCAENYNALIPFNCLRPDFPTPFPAHPHSLRNGELRVLRHLSHWPPITIQSYPDGISWQFQPILSWWGCVLLPERIMLSQCESCCSLAPAW